MAAVESNYDVIYVSCDTDSFAPPRQAQAVELLRRLVEFDVDLLFTTRARLTAASVEELAKLAAELARGGHMLIGCISMCQLSVPHLEPPPIPTPDIRLEQLRVLRGIGIRTILALRPFLPNVPEADYIDLVQRSVGGAEIVLGGVWYFDQGGDLERGVMGPTSERDIPYVLAPMPFDGNTATWRVFEGSDIESVIRRVCEKNNLPMFMRSGPAIGWLRQHGSGERR
nr:hypothetical protein [Nocardia concava]